MHHHLVMRVLLCTALVIDVLGGSSPTVLQVTVCLFARSCHSRRIVNVRALELLASDQPPVDLEAQIWDISSDQIRLRNMRLTVWLLPGALGQAYWCRQTVAENLHKDGIFRRGKVCDIWIRPRRACSDQEHAHARSCSRGACFARSGALPLQLLQPHSTPPGAHDRTWGSFHQWGECQSVRSPPGYRTTHLHSPQSLCHQGYI